MTRIKLKTEIKAPINVCFDLSRNVEFHCLSMAESNERAIAGKTKGLLEQGDWVTWQGRHFGFRLKHTSKITKFDRPHFFEDVMVKGWFRSLQHQHWFHEGKAGTLMTDDFYYELPLRLTDTLFDRKLIKPYMRRLLSQRNIKLKEIAEPIRYSKFNYK